ncbi:hypothetical protein A3F27_02950 [Candidatus Kaiserbacteria bacterium RIFCSPHIGHO2_12_FULL_53_13]|uniref:Uncharacterized protein n=1 Tax=Candidatus Kaiserbacteria bacterium RIFCSPHIGHO2_12_FULL_53_13 TaxID=1798502 RepID=A0A1F6EAH2_9BACT|nr:MAG: hypothetical protein A3F27_02950 [Candidatus Kaiserbacteria bacterium RIFCSPHIGHO2_12_FULL_53_13]OGG74525.1 MAG: hypothetical protein A3A37_02985 [Candidatus Kaiserbacteria bacterium RIFCSPLOWO2_01_FULL_52_36]
MSYGIIRKEWALVAIVALAPNLAFAQSVLRTLGYLDIFIGLFLAVSIVMFVGAFIVYFVRYGTMHREEMFKYMQWSISILFVLSVLLALIRFFQRHTSAMLYFLSVAAFILLTILIIYISAKKGEKKKEKK